MAKPPGARGKAGGDGEYLVRVGTENRQHVLGHISLLGYSGDIIAPMTTGGPDESALGDPVEILLTEWARQCKQQGGLVVLPHFPNPARRARRQPGQRRDRRRRNDLLGKPVRRHQPLLACPTGTATSTAATWWPRWAAPTR